MVTLTGGVLSEGTLSGTAFNLSAGFVGATLNGTGTLVKESAGTVVLNGANSYTGGTRVETGTLVLGVDGALTLNGSLTVNGGLLSLGATTQTLGAVTLNGGELAGGTIVASAYAVRSGTVSSVLAGLASLVKTTDGLVTLSGLNRYEGDTTVDAGTLVLGGSNVLFAAGALTVNGGTLDLGGAYQNTVSLLQLNGGQIVGGNGAGATITAGSFLVANGTISAVLAGDGALTKNTGGTVFLNGQNTYTGLTTVNAGRLVLGGNQVLSGTAALQVNGGALDLGGQYTNNVQTVTLVDGAIERGTIGAAAFHVSNGLISASLTGTGALTKSGAGTVTLSGQNSYTGETQVLGGRLVLGRQPGALEHGRRHGPRRGLGSGRGLLQPDWAADARWRRAGAGLFERGFDPVAQRHAGRGRGWERLAHQGRRGRGAAPERLDLHGWHFHRRRDPAPRRRRASCGFRNADGFRGRF